MQPKCTNRMSLPTLAKISNRFCVSGRAGASTAIPMLKTMALQMEKNKELIIDRRKIRRKREKKRRYNQSFQTPSSLQGLYFEGKKQQHINPSKVRCWNSLCQRRAHYFSCRTRFKLCWSFRTKQCKGKTFLKDSWNSALLI